MECEWRTWWLKIEFTRVKWLRKMWNVKCMDLSSFFPSVWFAFSPTSDLRIVQHPHGHLPSLFQSSQQRAECHQRIRSIRAAQDVKSVGPQGAGSHGTLQGVVPWKPCGVALGKTQIDPNRMKWWTNTSAEHTRSVSTLIQVTSSSVLATGPLIQ